MNSFGDEFFQKGFVRIRNDGPVSPDGLLEIASRFGALFEVERNSYRHLAIQVIGEQGFLGSDALPWHNDMSFGTKDYQGTLLYNSRNGHLARTWFVDMAKMCDALSADDHEEYCGVIGEYAPRSDHYTGNLSERRARIFQRRPTRRPMIFPHPVTGQDVLYFSPATLCATSKPVNVAALTDMCAVHAWAHDWQPWDILLYDNLRLMHRRDGFEGERELLRIQFSYGDNNSHKLRHINQSK